MKITDGNWIATQPENASGWWVIEVEDKGELGSNDGGFEEADAKVMAASKDLLAACIAMRGVLLELCKAIPPLKNEESLSLADLAIEKASSV